MPTPTSLCFLDAAVLSRRQTSREDCFGKRTWPPSREKDSEPANISAYRTRLRRQNWIEGWNACGNFSPRCSCVIQTHLFEGRLFNFGRGRPFANGLFRLTICHGQFISLIDASCIRSASVGHARSLTDLS